MKEAASGATEGGEASLFPVNVNLGGIWPNAWYSWEAQDVKDLKKAATEDGPNSPWAETIFQGLAHQSCTTRHWKDLARPVITRLLFLKLDAFFREEYQFQAERNQAANSAIPITHGMLAGMNDQYATGLQQPAIPSPAHIWTG